MIRLVRIPCPRCDGIGRTTSGYPCATYAYITADRRWHVVTTQGQCGYGRGHRLKIIDTRGTWVCEVCEFNLERHAAFVSTLDAAASVIAEMLAVEQHDRAAVVN